jgi:hypothetical protein
MTKISGEIFQKGKNFPSLYHGIPVLSRNRAIRLTFMKNSQASPLTNAEIVL